MAANNLPEEILFFLLVISVGVIHCGVVKRQVNEFDRRWRKDHFPSPKSNETVCGRSRYICDPTSELSDLQVRELEGKIIDSKSYYDCDSDTTSLVIGVAMVPGLYMNKNGHPDYVPITMEEKKEAAAEFARYLRDNQYSYMSSCRRLVMIVISRDDRQIFTAVAKDALDLLSCECVDDIYEEAIPELQSSLGEGLLHVVGQYKETYRKQQCTCKDGKCGKFKLSGGAKAGIIVGSCVLFFFGLIGSICICVKCGWCDGRGGGGGYHHGYHTGYGGGCDGGGGGGGGDSGCDGGGGDF